MSTSLISQLFYGAGMKRVFIALVSLVIIALFALVGAAGAVEGQNYSTCSGLNMTTSDLNGMACDGTTVVCKVVCCVVPNVTPAPTPNVTPTPTPHTGPAEHHADDKRVSESLDFHSADTAGPD
jgi:hypothetical protein